MKTEKNSKKADQKYYTLDFFTIPAVLTLKRFAIEQEDWKA